MARLQCAIDISIDVFPGMLVYPGECPTERHVHLQGSETSPVTCTHWSMTAHAGTHLDAPLHFTPGGEPINHQPPEFFEFKAVVLDGTELHGQGRHADTDFIAAHESLLQGADAVLIKTHHGALWQEEAFDPRHVAVAPQAALQLAQRGGVRLVGIDYFSVEPFGNNPAETHLALLRNGIYILEGIDLAKVTPGKYDLLCVPMRWRDGEAAPCRALLFKPATNCE